jgi:hypothetical protein
MPGQLRSLFCTILMFCQVGDPLQLWTDHKQGMMEDFLHQYENDAIAEQLALAHINAQLVDSGQQCTDFNLPNPGTIDLHNPEFDQDQERRHLEHNMARLNEDQQEIIAHVTQALGQMKQGQGSMPHAYFIDGPGGSGKTTVYNTVYNTLISWCRCNNFIVASSAWTGIAATLLAGGKTCHNLFKLPVPILDTSVCNVSPSSLHADFLRSVDIFIIDEASMVPAHALQAIDKMLQDINGTKELFGGKIFLLGGDFRQILPVVPRKPPAVVIEHCLKSSSLWRNFKTFQLSKNMRAGKEEKQFSHWLLGIGNGDFMGLEEGCPTNSVVIPDECVSEGDIVDDVFADVSDPRALTDQVILTPTNSSSLEVNEKVLQKIDAPQRTYFSTDTALTENPSEAQNFPPEFLHTLTPSGMPPHRLALKVGAMIMLLRNLDIKRGLCNGTRLIIHHLHQHVIDAEILTGNCAGNRVLIPRIKLAPSDTSLPFILERIQFPVRLSYSMTINKAQGQTFHKIGIYLDKPVFSHGQLYVALSRTKSFKSIHVQVKQTNMQGVFHGNTVTQNVVYKDVL